MSKNKVIVKSKISSVSESGQQVIGPIAVRKTLNFYGKSAVIALYTLAVFLFSLYFFRQQHKANSQIAELNELRNQQQNILEKLNSIKDGQNQAPQVDTARVMDHIAMLLDEREGELDRQLEEKDDQIVDLKRRLSLLAEVKQLSRMPSHILKAKTIAYSPSAMNVLLKEQRLELDNLREQHDRIVDSFVSVNDMSLPTNITSLKSIKHFQKIEIFELEAEQSRERLDFKKNKYRVRTI